MPYTNQGIYEWSKSVITERCSSVEAFITMVNQLINGRDQTSAPSASSSESADLLSSVHSTHPSSETTPSSLLLQAVPQSPQ